MVNEIPSLESIIDQTFELAISNIKNMLNEGKCISELEVNETLRDTLSSFLTGRYFELAKEYDVFTLEFYDIIQEELRKYIENIPGILIEEQPGEDTEYHGIAWLYAFNKDCLKKRARKLHEEAEQHPTIFEYE